MRKTKVFDFYRRSGKVDAKGGVLKTIARDLFVLEDTAEIQSKARNAIFLLTTGAAELVDLVRTALRGRPDRIVIGEIRTGSAALETLKAWNTVLPANGLP